jgi:hypothetical protein
MSICGSSEREEACWSAVPSWAEFWCDRVCSALHGWYVSSRVQRNVKIRQCEFRFCSNGVVMRMFNVLQYLRSLRCALVLALCVSAPLCFAQAEPELLSTHKDWAAYIFSDGAGKVCYMASAPLESSPDIDGRAAAWITVTHRPGASISSEIGVIAGYQYQTGSGVNALVETKKFALFIEGDGAWLRTTEEELEMVADMKKGRRLSVVGVSMAGDTTTDKYSLIGFTAAHRAITKACS